MDEPTASLDIANRALVLDIIRELSRDGRAIMLSTHEPDHAFLLADWVAAFGAGGHFATGPVALVLTPGELSRMYGIALDVERTPSGHVVVNPFAPAGATGASPEGGSAVRPG